MRDKDRVISAFNRELSNIVSLTTPKDVEDAVKDAYRFFVKGEKPKLNNRSKRNAKRKTNGGDNKSGEDRPRKSGGELTTTGNPNPNLSLNPYPLSFIPYPSSLIPNPSSLGGGGGGGGGNNSGNSPGDTSMDIYHDFFDDENDDVVRF